MKLLIASDLHGGSIATEQLIERFEAEGCDKMLLLGDILYHGPRNKIPYDYDCQKVIDRLNAVKDKIWCVKGNCDSEIDQLVLEFPMATDHLQIPIGNKVIFATHGHHIGPSNLPPIGSCDILMCGHTHVPEIRKYADGLVYANPGSTTIPKGSSQASYMTFDGNLLEQKLLKDGSVYNSYSFI